MNDEDILPSHRVYCTKNIKDNKSLSFNNHKTIELSCTLAELKKMDKVLAKKIMDDTYQNIDQLFKQGFVLTGFDNNRKELVFG